MTRFLLLVLVVAGFKLGRRDLDARVRFSLLSQNPCISGCSLVYIGSILIGHLDSYYYGISLIAEKVMLNPRRGRITLKHRK